MTCREFVHSLGGQKRCLALQGGSTLPLERMRAPPWVHPRLRMPQGCSRRQRVWLPQDLFGGGCAFKAPLPGSPPLLAPLREQLRGHSGFRSRRRQVRRTASKCRRSYRRPPHVRLVGRRPPSVPTASKVPPGWVGQAPPPAGERLGQPPCWGGALRRRLWRCRRCRRSISISSTSCSSPRRCRLFRRRGRRAQRLLRPRRRPRCMDVPRRTSAAPKGPWWVLVGWLSRGRTSHGYRSASIRRLPRLSRLTDKLCHWASAHLQCYSRCEEVASEYAAAQGSGLHVARTEDGFPTMDASGVVGIRAPTPATTRTPKAVALAGTEVGAVPCRSAQWHLRRGSRIRRQLRPDARGFRPGSRRAGTGGGHRGSRAGSVLRCGSGTGAGTAGASCCPSG